MSAMFFAHTTLLGFQGLPDKGYAAADVHLERNLKHVLVMNKYTHHQNTKSGDFLARYTYRRSTRKVGVRAARHGGRLKRLPLRCHLA